MTPPVEQAAAIPSEVASQPFAVTGFADVDGVLDVYPAAEIRKAQAKQVNALLKDYKGMKKTETDPIAQSRIGLALAYLEKRKQEIKDLEDAEKQPTPPPALPQEPQAVVAGSEDVPFEHGPIAPAAAPAAPAAPVVQAEAAPQTTPQNPTYVPAASALPCTGDANAAMGSLAVHLCNTIVKEVDAGNGEEAREVASILQIVCEAKQAYCGGGLAHILTELKKILSEAK